METANIISLFGCAGVLLSLATLLWAVYVYQTTRLFLCLSTALQIIAMLVLFPLALPCQTLYMSENQNMFWETLFEHEKGLV